MPEILAEYLRLSLEDGDIDFNTKDESNSIVNQRNLLNAYIAEHEDLKGMTVVEFCDDGKSGTNFDRPGIQKLLAEIKSGRVKCVIVKDFSRFGRNHIEVSDYLEQIFPFLGIRFISVNDRFDSNNYPYGTAGMIDIGFKQIMNQYYCETLSHKLRDTKKRLFKSGKFHSSFPFFGYRKSSEKYKLEVDEEAAATVRLIFDLCIQGKTTQEIAAYLNAAGFKTPLEKLQEIHPTKNWNTVSDAVSWTNSSVRRILTEERYTGKSIYGRSKVDKIGSRRCVPVDKEEWVVVPDMHELIISQETFDAAQKIRFTRQSPDNGKYQKRDYRAFITKVRCGHCGYAMKYHPGNNAYFQCERYLLGVHQECARNRVYERDLSELVLRGIHTQAQTVIEKTNNISVKETNVSCYTEELKTLNMKLNKIPLQKEQAFNQMLEGIISEEENARIYCELNDSEAGYKVEIEKLNEKVQQASFNASRDDELLVKAHSIANSQALSKELVDKFVQSISIFKDSRIEISWNSRPICDTIGNGVTDKTAYQLPPVCGKRVWLYYRTQSKDQSKDDSLQHQRDSLYNHAVQKGWDIVGESYDVGSGMDISRKGLSEILIAAEAGKMDVLLIKDINRISRDVSATSNYMKRLRDNKIRLIAIQGTPFYATLGA